MKDKDQVELEYEQAIAIACAHGDDEKAYELSLGLRQYRELYKNARQSTEAARGYR